MGRAWHIQISALIAAALTQAWLARRSTLVCDAERMCHTAVWYLCAAGILGTSPTAVRAIALGRCRCSHDKVFNEFVQPVVHLVVEFQRLNSDRC